MDERTLQDKYHIAYTDEGLIGALQHQAPEVRSFAAGRLAARDDKAAIRPVLDALRAETLGGVRIALAAAAAQLGSAEGLNALKSMCEDRGGPATMRMAATQTMVSIVGRQECLSDILDVLQSADAAPDDYPAYLVALNLLTDHRFEQIRAGQLEEIRDLCSAYLKNPASPLRIEAGMCVRDQGGPWAISQLRAAIDAEQDDAVRSALKQDLVSVGQ